jgi:hypothetical protein
MSSRFNPFRRAETPDPIPETNGATSAAILANGGGPDFTGLFIAAYGQPDAPKISLPYGHMAVTLCAKFNDSAPQVDHFDYHAGLGCPDFALLIVPKQSKTEKLARQALSLCPKLAVGAGLDWTWKSETWSTGHGNYLQSSSFELPPELRGCATFTFGRNTPLTQTFWEIEFTTNLREGKLVELWPHRNFRINSLSTFGGEGRGEVAKSKISASIILNPSKNGVEIHFTRRPNDAALQPLRDDRRWRYTGYSRCWYCRATPETIAWAEAFVTRFNSPSPNGDTTPAPPGSRAVRDVVSPALSERPPHRSTIPQLAPLRGMTPLGINP